jgi:hypothetical protein
MSSTHSAINLPENKAPGRFLQVLLLSTLIVGLGCGTTGPKNTVSGKVTYKGSPVEGSITFVTSAGKEFTGPITGGTYFLNDTPPGEVRVSIKGPPKMPGVMPGKDKLPDLPAGKGPAVQMGVSPPKKYESPENGLKYTVKGGKETKDFDLTD